MPKPPRMTAPAISEKGPGVMHFNNSLSTISEDLPPFPTEEGDKDLQHSDSPDEDGLSSRIEQQGETKINMDDSLVDFGEPLKDSEGEDLQDQQIVSLDGSLFFSEE